MAKLNLDERLVRVSEAQGQVILAAMLGALADVGVPGELRDAVRPAIARRLRLTSRPG